MRGINSVNMKGYLLSPKLTTTANGYPLFKGRIAVPIFYKREGKEIEGKEYHNICAWGSIAEALGEMLENTPIQIDGAINTRGYEGRCRHCNGPEKKYWTEIRVNNFVIVTEED
jgi:single-stranded DNA-binding protein